MLIAILGGSGGTVCYMGNDWASFLQSSDVSNPIWLVSATVILMIIGDFRESSYLEGFRRKEILYGKGGALALIFIYISPFPEGKDAPWW